MQVLVLSPPERRPGEGRLAGAMLEAGVARYHLRKPAGPPEALLEFFHELPEPLRPRVSVHGPFTLARTLGAGGCHGDPEAPRGGLLRSVPLHALAGAPSGWDYALLSPVYDSLSKPGRRAAFKRGPLRDWHDRRRARGDLRPVHALGGITPPRVAECRALGFAGVAALGFIWGAGDPLANAAALLAAARELS